MFWPSTDVHWNPLLYFPRSVLTSGKKKKKFLTHFKGKFKKKFLNQLNYIKKKKFFLKMLKSTVWFLADQKV